MSEGAVEGSPRGAWQENLIGGARMIEAMPWIRPEHVPVVRLFAEQDEIRRAMISYLIQLGENDVVHVDKNKDLAARRLVNDVRLITQKQLNLANALLMTPASRSQVAPGEEALDLVSLMTQAASTEPTEPEPPGEEPPVEEPPDDEPPVKEPDRPAPMKS
jgi:hypothetical protein